MSTEPVPNCAEPSGTWRTVQQASAELDIGERAVIKRISNGTLHAVKEERHWRVLLPVLPAGAEPSTEPIWDSAELPEPGAEPVPSDKDTLIAELQADVAFLRSQLQQRDVAESELRRLMLADKRELSELREQVKMLAAPIPYEVAEESRPDMLEASPEPSRDTQSALQAQQAVDKQESSKATGDRQEVAQKDRRAWWKFWERKE